MKTETNLAWSNIKKDKTRSILILLSIVMTTVLLTMIFIVGYGEINYTKSHAASWYGSYYGTYKGVTEAQTNEMRLRSEFTEVGQMAELGFVDNDRDLYLAWADDTTMKLNNMEGQLSEGHYPKKGNEIAAQPNFFASLGVGDAALGDTVRIPYRVDMNAKFQTEEFVICGLLKEPEDVSSGGTAFVSEEYLKSKIPDAQRSYTVYFCMDKSIGITSYNAKEEIKNMAKTLGIDPRYASDNYVYLMWELDPGVETILFCAIIAIVVILFSTVILYNIFQVGIVQKIQEYGRIKAIGATKKQLRQVVLREGMMLAGVGVSVGVFVGYGLSVAAFRWMVRLAENVKGQSSGEAQGLFCFPLLVLAVLLSLFAVWLSLRKPIRIVTSVSPVEAMRYQERGKEGGSVRKGRKSMGVWGMTLANLSFHKRRTVSTILAMGLSCVVFVILANVLGNVDIEYETKRSVAHGSFKVELSYHINDTAYPENNLDAILLENPMNEELLSMLKGIDGVTGIRTETLLLADVNGKKGSVRIVDKDDFETLWNGGGRIGAFDYEEAVAEDGIIYGTGFYMEGEGYSVGQTLNVDCYDGKMHKEVKAKLCGAFGYTDEEFVMTRDTYEKLGFSDAAIGTAWVDCDAKKEADVRAAINGLISEREHLKLTARADVLEEAKTSASLMRGIGYFICFAIAFISFMNMANTMVASVVTRKQEFGILQAVGMTNRQLNASLLLEGILFTAGPVLVATLIGVPIGYAVFLYGKNHIVFGMNVYHLPIAEMLCMIAALAFLQAGLSFLLSHNIKKESLVERIRFQD